MIYIVFQNLVGPIDSKYVESVEKEVIELKKEKRKMMDQIETLQGNGTNLKDVAFNHISMF